MVERLVLKAYDGHIEDSWRTPEESDNLYLCKDGVCRFFDVPENSPEIVLCASDKFIRGATEATVVYLDYSLYQLRFDQVRPLITKEIADWFPEGTFWFWIEY